MNLEEKLTECLREFCNTYSESAAKKVLGEFWVASRQNPDTVSNYQQDSNIIGYVSTRELDGFLKSGASHRGLGLDHPNCWGDEPPYEHLEPLYRGKK